MGELQSSFGPLIHQSNDLNDPTTIPMIGKRDFLNWMDKPFDKHHLLASIRITHVVSPVVRWTTV